MSNRVIQALAVCALLGGTSAGAAYAQDKYPTKPIRVVTPFAPGGGSDTLARLIGPQIHEAWGQPVIVDNRGGGGGTIGAGAGDSQRYRCGHSGPDDEFSTLHGRRIERRFGSLRPFCAK